MGLGEEGNVNTVPWEGWQCFRTAAWPLCYHNIYQQAEKSNAV